MIRTLTQNEIETWILTYSAIWTGIGIRVIVGFRYVSETGIENDCNF